MNSDRRNFLKATGLGAACPGMSGVRKAKAAIVRPEDWEAFFPSPPRVYDRLEQGMFETLVPENRFGQTYLLTSPTAAYVPNPGMGYQVYAYEEGGTPNIPGLSAAEAIDRLIRLPFQYREKYERGFKLLDRSLGYQVRPSWIWLDTSKETAAVVLGIKNDGCAPPPGILRIHLSDEAGTFRVGGGLDAGSPAAASVRICRIPLPQSVTRSLKARGGDAGSSLRLQAELEFYGRRHPVRWACAEPLNSDGSLPIRRTCGLELR